MEDNKYEGCQITLATIKVAKVAIACAHCAAEIKGYATYFGHDSTLVVLADNDGHVCDPLQLEGE